MNIDLSKFNNVDLEEENYKSTFRMQKIDQLKISIDTLQRNFAEQQDVFSENFGKQSVLTRTANNRTDVVVSDSLPTSLFDFIVTDETWKKSRVMDESIVKVRSSIRNLNTKRNSFFSYQKLINLHKITLQEKYTLLFASLLLFLIGAALGAIIRKGGIGLPLVLSVLIFLTYHYIGLFGKNAAEDNSIPTFFASWLSTFILAPFAIILTRRASADKGFVSLGNIVYPLQEKIKILFSIIKRKKKND